MFLVWRIDHHLCWDEVPSSTVLFVFVFWKDIPYNHHECFEIIKIFLTFVIFVANKITIGSWPIFSRLLELGYCVYIHSKTIKRQLLPPFIFFHVLSLHPLVKVKRTQDRQFVENMPGTSRKNFCEHLSAVILRILRMFAVLWQIIADYSDDTMAVNGYGDVRLTLRRQSVQLHLPRCRLKLNNLCKLGSFYPKNLPPSAPGTVWCPSRSLNTRAMYQLTALRTAEDVFHCFQRFLSN